MKGFFAVCICSCFFSLASGAQTDADKTVYGVLKIDRYDYKDVSPVRYGFHYEEIGMMGEGALHAELVRNRSFEEANPPQGLSVRNGLYENIPAPRARAHDVYECDPLIGWTTLPLAWSPIYIERTDDYPMNGNNRHSMSVHVTEEIADSQNAMIVNRGYYGMAFRQGIGCRLSLFMRNINSRYPVEFFLVDSAGECISNVVRLEPAGKEWKKYTAVLIPEKTDKRGMLAIRPSGPGRFALDVVSLFPTDTWDNGNSVFRSDIISNLRDFAPDFIRFPGGCIVHGVNEETMYKWKKTIGPAEQRPGQWSKWAPYYRTDGIGYHEFYELCEYTGADAMYVIPTGMVCTGWVFQSAPWEFIQPDTDIDAYIQDAVDAIEYAIGDTSTVWGALRARNGHPEPFPLKYIEIGNEDFGPVYRERYEKIYQALHSRYPDLVYIADSIIGKENDDKRGDIAEFPVPEHVEVFDEHYYQPVEWACNGHYRFDGYEREVADLFIGELGIDGKYPYNILATGVVRMALERNGDMNPMLAERPVMRNCDFLEHRNFHGMFLNDSGSSVKCALYYVSKIFRDNTFDRYISSSVTGFEDMQKVFATMGYDSASGEYILKIINLNDSPVILDTDVRGFGKRKNVRRTALVLPAMDNTPEHPDKVAFALENDTVLDLREPLRLEAASAVVYRFK